MIEIRKIDRSHRDDINIKNEPFSLRGRMIVERTDGVWSHREELLPPDEITQMTFPDENYDFDAMGDYTFLGAYDGDKCVGLAILCPAMSPYFYLSDLKVSSAARGRGIGRLLVDESVRIAHELNYPGLFTIGQDNNLDACLFYLACGFNIGGLDTDVYIGSNQEGKSDIYFYRR